MVIILLGVLNIYGVSGIIKPLIFSASTLDSFNGLKKHK